MFSRPALGLAEMAWRWTFGSTAILSLSFLLIEYLRTLPVSAGDIFLLRTRQPWLISQALAHIFGGSAGRLMRAGFTALMLLSVVWIILASIGRTAAIRALLSYLREGSTIDEFPAKDLVNANLRSRSPFGLNCLRVFAAVGSFLAFFGAFVLAQSASASTNPAPGTAMLIFLTLAMGICAAWWLTNWILSFAAIFAVAHGDHTFSAISKAVDLWRLRWGAIAAAGTWFGIAHTIVFFIATSVVAFPLAFAGVLPGGIVLGGVILTTLVYFAAADFLYAGKMAAYAAIAILPAGTMDIPRIPAPIVSPKTTIDRDELILSDVPALE